MSDSDATQTQGTGTQITPPSTAGGKEIYDSIMQKIEPDLVSSKIDTIDTMYSNETPEENKARLERYSKAFETYQEEYQKYREQQTSSIRSFGKGLVASVEHENVAKEETVMSDLESQISQM